VAVIRDWRCTGDLTLSGLRTRLTVEPPKIQGLTPTANMTPETAWKGILGSLRWERGARLPGRADAGWPVDGEGEQVSKNSRRANRVNRRSGPVSMLPLYKALADLDERMTEEKGPDWIYGDGPTLVIDGDEYALGARSKGTILEIRRFNALRAELRELGEEAPPAPWEEAAV